jgi:hypothetical protein
MSTNCRLKVRILTLLLSINLAVGASAQSSGSSLEPGFEQPPESAKPRVWWHWLNGNVTKEGITADLEWMKRVGIGGMQMFDGNLGTPVFVDKRLVWMTPEWKDAFQHAGSEATRLGLEMSMAASGGWSETAGPWVKPEEAMKKVVWSETAVEGPKKFSGKLPAPPSNNGRFQNIPVPPDFDFPEQPMPGAKPQAKEPPAPPDPTFYADTSVIAFRLPDAETRMSDLHPKVTSSAAQIDVPVLMDGDVGKSVKLPYAEDGKPSWVEFEFAQPFRAQAFTIAAGTGSTFGGPAIPEGKVQVSKDGSTWETIVDLPGPGHSAAGFPVRSYAFAPVTAKYYRVLFNPAAPNPLAAVFAEILGITPPKVTNFDMAELEFHSAPRLDHWEEKAGFANLLEYTKTQPAPGEQPISRASVVDLTSKMRKDGSLDWDVPAGRWVIQRIGYSLTGEKNHPATREATGYEVDKLNRQHVENYVRTYADMISSAIGPSFGKSFRYFLMDSWEASNENWTDDMVQQFRRLRGYDPTPFLPVLTGRVIESTNASERFLWDFRRTLSDLLAENHYRAATEYFKQRGVGLYAEAMGAGLPTVGDGLLNKGQADIPMGEFWTYMPGQNPNPEHLSDTREAASAAHIYGKGLAAAESFTSFPWIPAWGQSPFFLKPIGDRYLANGINRIVFHTSDAQPFVDDTHKPGMTLGPFGQHYTRNITWAEQAKVWNTYLARCSYLLQQGLFVGDAAYFYGEGAPITVPYWKKMSPAIPDGYNYDWVNADVILNRMRVDDGRIVLPDGMSYRVLVLPDDVNQLTLPVLKKIRTLVGDGAIVAGPKPGTPPGLSGFPDSDDEARAIVNEVWGSIDGKSVTEHAYGRGRVYWGKPLEEILAAQKIAPDFRYTRPSFDTNLVWIHRHVDDAEIYFVGNQSSHDENVLASFRVEGKEAELWHPDTGITEAAEYAIESGQTTVPLHFDPSGSVFVVFRKAASAKSRKLPHLVHTQLATVEGPWQVSFPPNWGAPAQLALDRLTSWTNSSDPGVKYFSGTASYSKDVTIPTDWLKSDGKLILNLGSVKEIAEVSVNGKPVGGILWKPPFEADITGALKSGINHLDIKVTNLWPNRMIGDQQPGVERTYTFTDSKFYKANSPLMDSGLLGPVQIVRSSQTSR